MPDYDVLVIGAGAAGMAAAHALSARGYSLAILEARDRIGGRMFTIRPSGSPLPVELGAEFVHGRAPETFQLAKDAGLTLCELDGSGWYSANGRLSEIDEEGGEDDEATILQAVKDWQGEDQTLQAFIDARFADDRWAAARRAATGSVEGFDAADPEQVSIRWLARSRSAVDLIQVERYFRFIDGYDRPLQWLRAGLHPEHTRLLLNTVVQSIHWQRGHVEVHARSALGTTLEAFTARAAVITLPLGVLAAPPDAPGAVRFSPDLPGKRAAVAQLAMGHAAKVVLRFREAFWEHDTPDLPRLERMFFLFSEDDVMPTWWTSYPLIAPILTGWAGGPRAAKLGQQSDEAVAGQALDALARALHVRRGALEAQLDAWHFHNWSTDPYAYGAYSYARAGGADALGALAAPIEDTLFFAGEATNSDGYNALVHGALVTGTRAAREIIAVGSAAGR
ncbi:MAG TPA: NAD(P)/FAD-dependent oxidoreductase [Ktedonobacterales bacterium]|nr:NAD(P)/FAD-dependent oxidoreductase [Ktedonobacterales bacterium]